MQGYQAQLGEYTLGKRLGSGQYSKVRMAEKCGMHYAVKYMTKTQDLLKNQEYLDLVLNEARIMKQLEHPNIVKLYEVNESGIIHKKSGEEVPALCLVFELVTGGDLFEYVAVNGRFSDAFARHYFHELVETLEYLQSKGIAHLVIKPENVLLDENFTLKLADFGFSAPLLGKSGEDVHHTIKGTEGSMAPEIHLGVPYSAEKADIFATGVLLFIMVAGHPPFFSAQGLDPRFTTFVKDNKLYWEAVSLKKPKNTFSPDFIELVNRLLDPDPAKRPSLAEIKKSQWYLGPLPSPEALANELRRRRQKIEVQWERSLVKTRAKKLATKVAKAAKMATYATNKNASSESTEDQGGTDQMPVPTIVRRLLEHKVRRTQAENDVCRPWSTT